MTRAAKKLQIRYNKAVEMNNKIAAEIGDGNGASGLLAEFFVSASKELQKTQRMVKNALNNGVISVDEYKAIIGI